MNTRQKCSYIGIVDTHDYDKIMIHLINLIHQFDQFDDYNKIMIHSINTQNNIKYTVYVIANYCK